MMMGSASASRPATALCPVARRSRQSRTEFDPRAHHLTRRSAVVADTHGARLARYRAAPWWPAASTLVIAELGLGAALLLPITFSDPNGVDPYLARLSIASVLIALPSLLTRRLEPARPILFALVAVAATYTLLSAGPQILFDLFGQRSGSFDAQVFWSSVAQAVGTLLIALAAWKTVAPEWRPSLRMGR